MKRQSIVVWSIVFLSFFIFFAIQSCRRVVIPGPNRAPIAKAGFDIKAEIHERVMFDGSRSYDPDGDELTYEWSLLSRPQYCKADLNGKRGMRTCSITPDAKGTWIVALTVYDKKLASTRDVVRLTVSDPQPPVTMPDLEVSDVRVFGETVGDKKYIQIIEARVKNNGIVWTDSLKFRVLAMDQLMGGHFVFDQTATLGSICLLPGDSKWYTIIYDRLEWPSDSSSITFGIKVDPDDTITEINESNNLGEVTIAQGTLTEKIPEIFYPKPDIAISDFSAKGIYMDTYVDSVKVEIKNNAKKYNGPMRIKFNALESSRLLESKVLSFDNICFNSREKKWIDLSRREIEIPDPISTKNEPLASFINYFVEVDFSNQIDESNEDNNTESFDPLIMDLVDHCGVTIFEEIRVRDSNAGMGVLKNNGFFTFDCRQSNKFDFYITLQNYCRKNNSVELYMVFDWAHLKADGKNKIIKKAHRVNFPFAGQMEINLQDIKIPTDSEFIDDFSPFAILAHHDKGYDVLFSAYVDVKK